MRKRWYQIPEVWLVLSLLLSAVVGSGALIAAALDHPDPLVADAHPGAGTALKPAH